MAYIGTSPSNGVRRVHTYTATAGQTTFTGSSTEGVTLTYADTNYIDVFQNGVLLGSADYTSTSGTSVVLAQGASVSDLVVIVVYDVFSVADTVSKTSGGSFDSAVTMSNNLTVSGSLTGTTATFTTADNTPQLTLESTDADANEGPVIDLKRNSSSPADDDNGPRIKFTGKNDAGEDVEYARVRFNIQDMTDGTEDGQMDIATMINGSLQNRLYINDTSVVINDAGVDSDFRVESDNDANAFFVEGSTGKVALGINTADGFLHIKNNFQSDIGMSMNDTSGSGGTAIRFKINGTTKGSIAYSGSGTSFNTSSDYRLKENVDYTFDATTRLKQLKPCRFNFIADPNTTVDGFLAHEVTAVPEAVSGEKDSVDEDGNIDPQGIDQSKIVPLLVKTIQELEARITALESA